MQQYRFEDFAVNGVSHTFVEPEVLYGIIYEVETSEELVLAMGDSLWLKSDVPEISESYRCTLASMMSEQITDCGNTIGRYTTLSKLELETWESLFVNQTQTRKLRSRSAMQIIREQVAVEYLRNIVN